VGHRGTETQQQQRGEAAMAQAPSDSDVEEVVVIGYRDGPDTTDTSPMQIPGDIGNWYNPLGPVVVNPPPEWTPPGGGGSDNDPCKVFAQDSYLAYGAGLVAEIIAMVPGAGEIEIAGGLTVELGGQVVAVMGAAVGLNLSRLSDDPPQAQYASPASAAPIATSLPTAAATEWVQPLVRAEQQARLLLDAIERAQGAFLAADAPWVQRHTLTAAQAYRDLGHALMGVAERFDEFGSAARRVAGTKALAAPSMSDVRKVLAAGAQLVRVSPDELRLLEQRYQEIVGRFDVTLEALGEASAFTRRVGARLHNAPPRTFRFVFRPRARA
jgi:hypothetical protein